ncbi:PAAR domain-containing protein [Amorphus sp. MBR-141]
MPLIIRLGDGSNHGGVVSSGAEWDCEGEPIARVGDILECPLHGPQPIVEGVFQVGVRGATIARLGDRAACGAALISGGGEVGVLLKSAESDSQLFSFRNIEDG